LIDVPKDFEIFSFEVSQDKLHADIVVEQSCTRFAAIRVGFATKPSAGVDKVLPGCTLNPAKCISGVCGVWSSLTHWLRLSYSASGTSILPDITAAEVF